MAPVTVSIKNGPSKFNLMLALFDRSASHPRPVTFVLKSTDASNWWAENYEMTVHITSVEVEDGSGHSWCFKGQNNDGRREVKGWFRTDTREGTVELECPLSKADLSALERMGSGHLAEMLAKRYRASTATDVSVPDSGFKAIVDAQAGSGRRR